MKIPHQTDVGLPICQKSNRGLCCKALIYELEEKQPKLSATMPKSLKKETCLPAAPDQYSMEARVIGSNHTIIDIYMYKTYTNH